jgi:dTDP-4-dehydrorhamnose reductase
MSTVVDAEEAAQLLSAQGLVARSSEKIALVTGGRGLMGRAVTARLSEVGWSVTALGHAELDITDQKAVIDAFKLVVPNLVINCAATADVDRCEREPDWAFAVNERGPRLLARSCRETGAELVHIGTDYVFDGKKEGFYTQEDRPNPLSVYAKSKLAGERSVSEEHEAAYIVRTSWIFGTGGKNFGSRVLEYARSGASLKGVVDQTSIPTYAQDLAARIADVVDLGAYGLYQITSTGPATWYDFALEALRKAGLGGTVIKPVTRAELGQPAPRPRNSAMRCLLSERLGFAPLRHWRDALAEWLGAAA